MKLQTYSDGTMILIVKDKSTGERIASVRFDKDTSIADLKKEAKKWKNKGAIATGFPAMTKEEDFDPDA